MKILHFLSLLIIFFSTSIASADPICTNGFTLANNKCLRLFTNTTNYKSAEKSCREYGATLATVKDATENTALTTFVGSSAQLVWLGLYCLQSDVSKCIWDTSSSQSAAGFDSFANGFPLVEEGKCVYLSVGSGKWVSGDCDGQRRAFVCELPTTVADDCTYNYNGNCYTFHDKAKFGDAQATCQSECGNLASITLEQENRYLTSLSSRLVSGDVLIGGVWPSADEKLWIDGSQWTYSNIDPAYQHIMNCMAIANSVVHFATGGSWYAVSCGFPYSFVCKRPAGAQCGPATVAPTSGSTVPPPTILATSNCNATLPLSSGFFTSPNFPLNLDTNVFCTYQLNTVGSNRVLLRIVDFVSASSSNVLNVYDGDSSDAVLLGSFNGYTPLTALVSSGNTMLVTFSSGPTSSFQGFSATYSSYSG